MDFLESAPCAARFNLPNRRNLLGIPVSRPSKSLRQMSLVVIAAISILVFTILLLALCCTKSDSLYEAAPVPSPSTSLTIPLAGDSIPDSPEFPVPAACDPSQIPPGLDFNSAGFVSVTGRMTSTYEYQEQD
jgi:hypothetical protein